MPVTYEVTADHKALYNKKTLKEWLSSAVDDLVSALDPVQIYLFGSLACGDDGPDSDLDLMVVFEQLNDDQIWDLTDAARRSITAPVPRDVLVTDLARYQFNQQRPWHIHHQVARTGVLVYERVPRIPKELYMNPERPDDIGDAEMLLAMAREDLTASELLKDRGIERNARFDAQQAAEKALKALLIVDGKEPARVHELSELAATLPSDHAALFDKEGLDSLTPWAVAGRYPGDMPDGANKPTDYLVGVAKDTVNTAEGLVSDLRQQREKSARRRRPG